MAHQLRNMGTIAAASIASLLICSPVTSAMTSPVSAASIGLHKQSQSVYSLCQTELRRRLGGDPVQVSLSNVTESSLSGAATRLTGNGTYSRSGSNAQNFNFSCTVNVAQSSIASLAYTITGFTTFDRDSNSSPASNGSFGSPSNSSFGSPRSNSFGSPSNDSFGSPRTIRVH